MFARERDALKVALVHLVDRLRLGGFRLLDVQMLTEHTAHVFGVLPYLLLLACPLMHFLHRGHKGHGRHGGPPPAQGGSR